MGPLPEDITEGEFDQLPGAVALSMTAAAVADGIASGELRSDLDPVAAAVTLWALVHGTVMVLLQKRGRPWKPFSEEQLAVGSRPVGPTATLASTSGVPPLVTAMLSEVRCESGAVPQL